MNVSKSDDLAELLNRPLFPIHTPPIRHNTHRVIRGLELAWQSEAPHDYKKPKYRGAKAEGIRFEKAVGTLLAKGAQQGVWFHFKDENGPGYCQPDWIVQLEKKRILIVECKRTECPEATTQLTKLYFPVVQKATGLMPIGIVCCNYLTTSTPTNRIFADMPTALNAAYCGLIPILHWMR